MSAFNYRATLVQPSTWTRMDSGVRGKLKWSLHMVTWLGLVAGLFDPFYWEAVVWWSAAHALLVLGLVGFRPLVFPAQIRIAYFGYVAIGVYVPHMEWMMYVTLVGLAANIFAGWCPLARMLYLLPWNREEAFDRWLPVRTFFSGPKPGRFRAAPPTG